MMERESKNSWVGFFIGSILVFIALGAIWKNESRFDYHQAAKKTQAVNSPQDLLPAQRFSYTERMDPELVLPGDYVEAFTGYLMVRRSAEIYAWDKDTDSDNNVTWSRRWMSSVENNSRNQGISQQLSSRTFTADEYQLGALTIDGLRIEFVDPTVTIAPFGLQVTHPALRVQGDYLYLLKGQADKIGDERIRYSGIPVPATATYFGKADSGRGVADTSQARTGMINALIQDSGVLHHIVAGDRETALATMAAHISRLKWIVRGVASLAVVIGFSMLFGSMLGFLYSIPVIGSLARSGSFLLSLVLALPLILITMLGGYLFSNPLVLVAVVVLIGGGLFALGQRKKATQRAVSQQLENQYGAKLQTLDLTELEFIGLATLAFSDGHLDPKEEQFLRRWSRKQGWNDARFTAMLAKANQMGTSDPQSGSDSEEQLKNLIRLALADGDLSRSELNVIQNAAKRLGFDQGRIVQLVQQVQSVSLLG